MIKVIKKYFFAFCIKSRNYFDVLKLSNESSELIAKIKFPCC
jgi:hypothetical protein